ncbi:MAG: LuxR family transcriptional regulator [Pseudomonadota bacterium]
MTFSVLTEIQNRKSNAGLWELVLDYFHANGIEKVSYHHLSTDAQSSTPVTVNADGFSPDWVCHYIDRKLYLVDPITELAQSRTQPFRWSQIENLMQLSVEQKAYLRQMRAADIHEGLAFQVFGPGLRNAYVGLGLPPGQDIHAPEKVLDFQLLAQASHLKFCEMNPVGGAAVALSPREREVLHWIARGKSNSSIAEILALSPPTVDTLLRRIFDKLGVADRTTAAIRGVGSGLILP